jgi:GxxExxY protein
MARDELIEARLTHSVIGAFYEVYTTLGFGFFESIYANALEHELKARGHRVVREVRVQVVYKGHVVGIQSVDQIIDEKLVVETKSSQELPRGAPRQVPSYLKAMHLSVGLLLHFGPVPRFYRYVNRGTTTNPKNPTNPKQ